MKTLFIILQAQAQGQPAGSSASMWILLLLMFVVMWFFMISLPVLLMAFLTAASWIRTSAQSSSRCTILLTDSR